jgi:outer membrane protein assembly factor BamB
LIGLEEQTGQELWRYTRIVANAINMPTPIHRGGYVFASTRDGGGALLKLGARTAGEVYFTPEMKNHYAASVLVGDFLYGYSNSILTAMEFKTGRVMWRQRTSGLGSLIAAGNQLYTLGDDGQMTLVETSPLAYHEISRFDIDIGPRPSFCPFFPLPVISDGRLLVRIREHVIAYDIRAG